MRRIGRTREEQQTKEKKFRSKQYKFTNDRKIVTEEQSFESWDSLNALDPKHEEIE